MIFSLATAVVASIVAVQAAPTLERRSNYPPNYPTSFNCKEDGPVRVCSVNQASWFPVLTVTYARSGYLWSKASPLSAYVKINGVDDTFGPFEADQGYLPLDQIPSARAQDVQICYHPTEKDNATYTEAPYPRCPRTNEYYPLIPGEATQGGVGWFADNAVPKEYRLIGPAKGQNWTVEVAVVNEKGDWDSKYGQNYKFFLQSF
ncbi:hypothetical protein HDU97_001910 [Phlyctochytrium planicorne]|nr:hypothetical protein HDU97_001910 [Phlyctochytrium planicorne]